MFCELLGWEGFNVGFNVGFGSVIGAGVVGGGFVDESACLSTVGRGRRWGRREGFRDVLGGGGRRGGGGGGGGGAVNSSGIRSPETERVQN